MASRKLLLLPFAAALLPGPAWATGQGGTLAPAPGGGTQYGQTVLPHEVVAGRTPSPHARPRHRRGRVRRRSSRGPVLRAFELDRPKLFLYGRPARVTFRIDDRRHTVRVRLYLRRPGSRKPVTTILLGERPTGRSQSALVTGRESGVLPQGRYVLGIAARDRRGRRLRRAPSASAVSELVFLHHRFPLAGSFSYGGPDSRFGAPRSGHIHQGQDLAAAEGTPVVAPRGGVVQTVQYQAGGAGYYVVLRGADEDRDYVFMHLRAGSIRVRAGQPVRTGQRIGEVGSTGHSSGAHLHFELWLGGWFAGGHPIDPLAYLQAWSRWS